MHYKSRNTTISDYLNGIAKKNGFEYAKALVRSGRFGKSQREADFWLFKEQAKHFVWPLLTGIALALGAIADFKDIW